MKTIHRIGALVLLIFVFAHIANHVAGFFGIEAHQAFAGAIRKIYRNPIGEPFLIALLGIQLTTGASLALASAKRERPRSIASAIELIAAGLFAAFILIHLTAVAMSRYYFGVQTDFFWIADLFRPGPMRIYIIAFHYVGIVAVMTHAGFGVAYFCESIGAPKLGRRIRTLIVTIGIIAGALSVAAYGGIFFETGI